MKTYVIYNDTEIKVVIKTEDATQVEANKKQGKYIAEVDSGWSPFYYKVVNGKLVEKTQEELRNSI